MKAHDVRHLRLCKKCGELGDNRQMLMMTDGPWHDQCVTATLTTSQILRLPAAERSKITIRASGIVLMEKLMAASHLELVKG